MKNFIKEYADYKKKEIEANTLMKEKTKLVAEKNINGILNLVEKELITVDEAMENIAHCFN